MTAVVASEFGHVREQSRQREEGTVMSATVPGQRWYGTSSTVELIVVKGGASVLACAGSPMALERPESVIEVGDGDVVSLGKRFEDAESGTLVLITKDGRGPLTADGRVCVEQAAQPLPSSD